MFMNGFQWNFHRCCVGYRKWAYPEEQKEPDHGYKSMPEPGFVLESARTDWGYGQGIKSVVVEV